MTRRQLEKRILFWQERLREFGVGHWRVESVEIVDECVGGPESAASVHYSDDYDSAWFQFKREHAEAATPQRLDEDIVHEWLHIAWRNMDDTMKHVASWMPSAAYEDHMEYINHGREGLIEQTARYIVRVYGETATLSV